VAYLAKETAVFLIPALWLALLLDPEWRPVLRTRGWFLAHGIALLVVLPEITWDLAHRYESYLARDQSLVGSGFSVSLRVFQLFLGELRSGFRSSFDLAAAYGQQNPAQVHWPAGLLYLGSAGLGFLRWRQRPIRLLLVTFVFVLGVFTVLPTPRFLWWWPSLAVPPAIVLAAWSLQSFAAMGRRRWKPAIAASGSLILALGFVVYLTGRSVAAASRTGQSVPMVSAEEWIRRVAARGQAAETEAQIREMNWRLVHALHIAGADPRLTALLWRTACVRGELDRARYFLRRTQALAPGGAVVREGEVVDPATGCVVPPRETAESRNGPEASPER
jgi:4-amino-4-deoxy-L-arabinose transferase-like glycosyltransferase